MLNKSFLIIAGAISGAVLIATLFILPAYQEAKVLRQEVASEEDSLQRKKDLISQIEALTEKFQQSQDKVEKINLIVPQDPNIPEAIIQLESLAARSGMILGSIDLGAQKSGQLQRRGEDISDEETSEDGLRYKTLLMKQKVIGSYSSFKNYLKAVEENMRLIDVVSVIFSSPGSEDGRSVFEYTLSLNAYWQ